jgi:hypothetical protein
MPDHRRRRDQARRNLKRLADTIGTPASLPAGSGPVRLNHEDRCDLLRRRGPCNCPRIIGSPTGKTKDG